MTAVRWTRRISPTCLVSAAILVLTLAVYFMCRDLHSRMLTVETVLASSLAHHSCGHEPRHFADGKSARATDVAFVERLLSDQLPLDGQREQDILPSKRPGDQATLPQNNLEEQLENEKVKGKAQQQKHHGDTKHSEQVKDLLSRPKRNEFNIHYILANDRMCSQADVEVLFVIPSAPNNHKRRSRVRNGTQVAYAKDVAHKARVVFFIGLPSNRSNTSEKTPGQSALEQEAEQYGDIVLVDFVDTYRNILVKHLAMLKWALSFCSQTKFVIRTDDDVVVDPVKLIEVVRRYQLSHKNFILGRRRVNDPVARVKNKYYLSREEYAPDVFPPYVLGGCIGYPLTTVHLLYEAAQRIKTIWLDDAFLTGICAQAVHIQSFADPDFDFLSHTP